MTIKITPTGFKVAGSTRVANTPEKAATAFGSMPKGAARQARNPRTGESLHVPAMKVPKFRPAKALKDMVK